MEDFSFVTNAHPAYIESLYNDYLSNPRQVDPEYKKFFEGFDFAISKGQGVNGAAVSRSNGEIIDNGQLRKEFAVLELIKGYRKRAHLIADTNPIRPRKDRKPHLDLAYFGLGDEDLESSFEAGQFIGWEKLN